MIGSQKNPGDKASGREPGAPRLAPPPEGPDQIDARVARLRKGFWGHLRHRLWQATGLDDLTPRKKAVVLFVGTAETVLIGLGIFTDLPVSWLVTAGVGLLTLFIHGDNEDEEDPEPPWWRRLLRLPPD